MAKAAGVVPVTINIKIPQGATFIERYFFLTVNVRASTGEIEVFYPVEETLKLTQLPDEWTTYKDGCGYYRDIRIIYDDGSEDCIVTGRVMPILEVSRI